MVYSSSSRKKRKGQQRLQSKALKQRERREEIARNSEGAAAEAEARRESNRQLSTLLASSSASQHHRPAASEGQREAAASLRERRRRTMMEEEMESAAAAATAHNLQVEEDEAAARLRLDLDDGWGEDLSNVQPIAPEILTRIHAIGRGDVQVARDATDAAGYRQEQRAIEELEIANDSDVDDNFYDINNNSLPLFAGSASVAPGVLGAPPPPPILGSEGDRRPTAYNNPFHRRQQELYSSRMRRLSELRRLSVGTRQRAGIAFGDYYHRRAPSPPTRLRLGGTAIYIDNDDGNGVQNDDPHWTVPAMMMRPRMEMMMMENFSNMDIAPPAGMEQFAGLEYVARARRPGAIVTSLERSREVSSRESREESSPPSSPPPPKQPYNKYECLSCDNNRRSIHGEESPTTNTSENSVDNNESMSTSTTPWTSSSEFVEVVYDENDDVQKQLYEDMEKLCVCCLKPIPNVVLERLPSKLPNLECLEVCDHWENLQEEWNINRPNVVVNRIFGNQTLMKSLKKLVVRCAFDELHVPISATRTPNDKDGHYLRNLEELELMRCHDLQRVVAVMDNNASDAARHKNDDDDDFQPSSRSALQIFAQNKLRRLHLRYCQSTQALKQLFQIFPNIEDLHLESSNAQLPIEEIGKLLPKLRTLKIRLASNLKTLIPAATSKASLPGQYCALPKLYELEIEYMPSLEFDNLWEFISKYCPKLQILGIRDDRLADQHKFEESLKGLCEFSSLLRTLYLGWNNDRTRSTVKIDSHDKNLELLVNILNCHGQLCSIEMMNSNATGGCTGSRSTTGNGAATGVGNDSHTYGCFGFYLSFLTNMSTIDVLLRRNSFGIPFLGMQKYARRWAYIIAAIDRPTRTKKKIKDGDNINNAAAAAAATSSSSSSNNTTPAAREGRKMIQANAIYDFLRNDPTVTGHCYHLPHCTTPLGKPKKEAHNFKRLAQSGIPQAN